MKFLQQLRNSCLAILSVACLVGPARAQTLSTANLSPQPDSLPGPSRPHWIQANLKWTLPATLVALGTLGTVNSTIINRKGVMEERQENFPDFHTRLDNYGQFVPMAAVYVLDAVGVRPKHDIVNRSVILLKAEVIMMITVHGLKNWTHILRPDSSDYHSFPSGHTAQAFLAANFLQHELGYRSAWYTVGGYTVASVVGALRVLNNKHWISDVLAGAGIGMLSSELAYATHKFKWNKKKRLSGIPYYGPRGGGIYLCYRL